MHTYREVKIKNILGDNFYTKKSQPVKMDSKYCLLSQIITDICLKRAFI